MQRPGCKILRRAREPALLPMWAAAPALLYNTIPLTLLHYTAMTSQIDFEQARLNMVEQQIRPWEVLDHLVLDLLHRIHREDFVPGEFRQLALADLNIPLANGQVMMTPKVEARLLQALAIRSNESVLEVGTGSGYLTALLAASAGHVESIDIFPEFTEQAKPKISDYGLKNVDLYTGDYLADWKRESVYDIIVLTGSLPELDFHIQEQLAVGGRLFVVTGVAPVMEALLITRVGDGEWSSESLFETELPALVGAEQPSGFQF